MKNELQSQIKLFLMTWL